MCTPLNCIICAWWRLIKGQHKMGVGAVYAFRNCRMCTPTRMLGQNLTSRVSTVSAYMGHPCNRHMMSSSRLPLDWSDDVCLPISARYWLFVPHYGKPQLSKMSSTITRTLWHITTYGHTVDWMTMDDHMRRNWVLDDSQIEVVTLHPRVFFHHQYCTHLLITSSLFQRRPLCPRGAYRSWPGLVYYKPCPSLAMHWMKCLVYAQPDIWRHPCNDHRLLGLLARSVQDTRPGNHWNDCVETIWTQIRRISCPMRMESQIFLSTSLQFR